MKKVLTILAKRAFEHINDTPPGVLNVTEWAKKDRCWESFAGKSIAIELGEEDGLRGSGAKPGQSLTIGSKKPKSGSKELPKEMCDAAAWLEMTRWSMDRDDFDAKARRFMKGVSAILRKKQEFTAAQVKWAVSIWASAAKAGFNA
jgi:hypothetical protein